MPVNNPDRDWEKYGKEDPYFGVVSLDRFRRDNLTPDALREFFDSGRQHMGFVLATIRSHIAPDFQPQSALDFGCGVGRCTIPMAHICPRVTGVDVSESMLTEARKNAESDQTRNIEWISSGDLSGVRGPFDLIHSFIVFQHIPPDRGLVLLERLVDLLAPGGVASIQFLYHKDTPAWKHLLGRARVYVPFVHGLANWLYGKPFGTPLMQKNVYDLNRVLNLLQKRACGNCHIRLEGTGEFQGAVVFFQKKQDAVPYDAFYR